MSAFLITAIMWCKRAELSVPIFVDVILGEHSDAHIALVKPGFKRDIG